MYHRHRNPFDASQSGRSPAGTVYPSSMSTSGPCWMGDFNELSMQVWNDSVVTLQGTMRNGWAGTAIAEGDWSTLSTIAAAGAYSITPTTEWMRFLRSSSTQTILYAGQEHR